MAAVAKSLDGVCFLIGQDRLLFAFNSSARLCIIAAN
jgi:hypothetical protein